MPVPVGGASSPSSSQSPSLTAFLQLLLVAVSSAEPLPAPTLATDPSYRFYYEGESFALICLAATWRKIGGFRFFNQSGEQIDLRAPYPLPKARLQLTATKASAGEYTCTYFVEDSGQQIPSNRSLPVSVEVQGDVKEVQYYADFGLAISIPVSNVKNYSFHLDITGEEVSGSYSCAYFVFLSSRRVSSESSRWINVYVKSHKISWIREIVVGGSFFTINGLIFFVSHRLMKRRELQD